MKQRKFGKKIQNWHRPLGPSQLRRRFLKHRYDDPEYDERGQLRDDSPEVDDYWDCYDPCGPDCEICGVARRDDPFDYHLLQFMRSVTSLPPPLIPYEWAVDAASAQPGEDAASRLPVRQGTAGIEERLASHVGKLKSTSSSADALRPEMVSAIGDWRNLEVVKHVAEQSHAPDFVTRVCMFAPFWVHSPRTWDARSGRPLVHHLFGLYDVPAFLASEWFRESEITRFKWLCWFILFAQGGSLKRAAHYFDWDVPAGFAHHLAAAPADLSPTEACILAEVRRQGGDEIDCRRILRNPAFVIDPTERSAAGSHRKFWHDTLRWLIAHREAITDQQSDLILSWAMHEYTETDRAGLPAFSWKGRRVRAVLERSVAYHREVENPWYRYSWQGHGWDWVLEVPPHGKWSFVELTSGDELFQEGKAMRHCVASYAGRCASGYSAIVSLRYNQQRRVTIEITPRTKQIVQARGLCNRPADAEAQRALSLWMATVVRADGQHDPASPLAGEPEDEPGLWW